MPTFVGLTPALLDGRSPARYYSVSNAKRFRKNIAGRIHVTDMHRTTVRACPLTYFQIFRAFKFKSADRAKLA